MKKTSSATSGLYRLHVANALGSDECQLKVQVSDVPEPPRFPVVENVRDESVSLSWKPPASDGGSPISRSLVERREVLDAGGGDASDADAGWHKCTTTRMTHFTDEMLSPAHKYQYRVVAQNMQGRSVACEPTAVIKTLESEMSNRRKKWLEDETGKRKRGRDGFAPSDYDSCGE